MKTWFSLILFVAASAHAGIGSLPSGPVQLIKNGAATSVNQDTVTPANNVPLPAGLYDAAGNPITSSGGAVNTNAIVSLPSSNNTGGAVPSQANYVGGNKGGLLTGLLIGQQTMANSLACVLPSDQSAIPTTISSIPQLPATLGQKTMANSLACTLASDQSSIPVTGTFFQATQPVSSTQLPAALDGSGFLKVHEQGTASVSVTNASLAVTGTVTANQGLPGPTASPWPVAIQGTVPVSGTFWQATQPVSGTVTVNGPVAVVSPVPAGTNIIGKVGIDQTTPGTTNGVQINAALPAGTNNIGKVQDLAPVNANASTAQSTTLGSVTAVSFTAPANATGALVQASSSNLQNVRCMQGGTATISTGTRFEPGRSEQFTAGVAISCIAEAGTNQEVDIQWTSQ